MLNFTGKLSAPNIEQPPVFVATYSDGFNLKRKEIHAPTRHRPPATGGVD